MFCVLPVEVPSLKLLFPVRPVLTKMRCQVTRTVSHGSRQHSRLDDFLDLLVTLLMFDLHAHSVAVLSVFARCWVGTLDASVHNNSAALGLEHVAVAAFSCILSVNVKSISFTTVTA